MNKTLLYARESVAFDEVLSLVDADGVPIDITGWTFSLELMRQAGSTDLTLDMNPASGDGGFAIVDGSAGELRMAVLQSALAGVADTTGDFTLFGDLLGTAPSSSPVFVRDIRLNVTVAGVDFPGGSYRVTLDAAGAVFLADMQAKVDKAEQWADEDADTEVESGRYSAKHWASKAGQYRFGTGDRGAEFIRLVRSISTNGAVVSGMTGIKAPNGTSGMSAYIQPRIAFDGAANAGRTIELVQTFTQSATFTRTLYKNFRVSVGGVETIRAVTPTEEVSGTRRTLTWTYTVQGDEEDLRPLVQFAGSGVTGTDETLSLTSAMVYYTSAVDGGLTAMDEVQGALAAYQARRIARPEFGVTLGNLVGDITLSRSALNGAALLGTAGLTIPGGSTGNNSVIQPVWIWANIGQYTGKTVRVALVFEVSAGFSRGLNGTMQVYTSSANVNRAATIRQRILSATEVMIEFEYQLQGDETRLQPVVTIAGLGNTAADETITLAGFIPSFAASDATGRGAADDAIRELLDSPARLALGYGRNPALVVGKTATVAASGADYTAVADAVAGEAPRACASDRTRIAIAAGVFPTAEFETADYVDLSGVSPKDTIIDGSQADEASENDLKLNSAILMQEGARIEALTIRAKNARYALHLDGYGNFPNRVYELARVHVEHLGNDDAPANSWTNQCGVGAGMSSGCAIIARDSVFVSKNAVGFFYHTNANFAAPSMFDAEGCTFVSQHPNAVTVAGESFCSFGIQPIGSFHTDECRLVGNSFGGKIVYKPTSWQPTALDRQPADHSEISVYGHGNSPAIFIASDWGKALRIESATTGASSSVEIGGDAVALIFGDGADDRYYTREGSAGLAGAVWGWGDISGVLVGPAADQDITKLGKRLGDCSSVNKTLNVTVDGGAPIVITFDADYTATDNATIIAAIDAALGSAATASEYQPGRRYRPKFTDEEKQLLNSSGSAILMGMALAYDGMRHKVRPMTSADAASLFAGIAWEDIEAGKQGRVKTNGYLPIGDVLRTDAAAFTMGATFSVDAAEPGKVYLGGAQGLLPAIATEAVEVGAA